MSVEDNKGADFDLAFLSSLYNATQMREKKKKQQKQQ